MVDFINILGSTADDLVKVLVQIVSFLLGVFSTIYSIFVFLITNLLSIFLLILNIVYSVISLVVWMILNPFLVIGIIEVYCIGMAVIATYQEPDKFSKPFVAIKVFLNNNKVMVVAIYDFMKWYFTMLMYIIPKLIEFFIRIVDIIVPDWL